MRAISTLFFFFPQAMKDGCSLREKMRCICKTLSHTKLEGMRWLEKKKIRAKSPHLTLFKTVPRDASKAKYCLLHLQFRFGKKSKKKKNQ